MEHPDRHLYHVVLRADGFNEPVIDLYGGLNVDLEPHASKDSTHPERSFAITPMPNPDTL